MAGRRDAVVEDDFYDKLEKLNVQAGKRDKILLVHVQRICEAHDTVMRPYYQQIQGTENSNLHGFEVHRPSSKGTKLLLQVIKAIINQYQYICIRLF